MAFSPNAQTVYADGPAGSPQQPAKSEIRKLLKQYENVIEAFLSNGGLIFASLSALSADLAHGANSMAWVLGDATVANNGIYRKIGASGTGSWTRVADLPFSFIIASDVGAGTANAIQATTSIPVSSSALVWTNVFEANTSSPVTISFNGGSALTMKTNSGNNVAAGGLVAGMIVMGIVSDSTFRLVSDQASAAIVAAAEGFANAAAASATAAAASAAGVNLPTAVAGTYLRQKLDTTGYETRTAAQVASDINVQQRNIDGGFTMAATSTTQAWDNGLYGGGFFAAHRLSSTDPAANGGSRGTLAIDRKVQGSGSNGPAFADVAFYASVSKTGYYTNSNQGEIDGGMIFVGQGALGDAGGLLIDLEKVGGSTGAGVGLETAVKKIDTAGATVQRVQSIVNFGVESPGGPSISTGYGYWTEVQVGGVYSAFHADQSKASTGALWQNLMTFCEDRDAAKMIYRIDGSGHVLTKPGTQGSPAYSFLLDPDTGIYNLGANMLAFSTQGAVRGYFSNSGLVPGADNAYSLGAASTGRWANIYSVNAVTVGSDKRLKDNIIDSPLGLEFIEALRAVAYNLKVGGTEIEYVDDFEEIEEQETVEGEIIREERYFDGDKEVIIQHNERGPVLVWLDPVQATDPQTGELLFRDVQVPRLDDDGLPIVKVVPREPSRVRSETGEIVEISGQPEVIPVTDTVREPVMRAVPKMKTVRKPVTKPVEVSRTGRRQHFGLIAQEVQEALQGVDFGGHVIDDMSDPDSLQSLRYEQFVPILIKAVQELSARVKELESMSTQPPPATLDQQWR
ncbi:tail fiber domain-containing protein [Ensifer oleiphilus]|nr:tail fiber domain-containing protein [Ensifer oleiphilus]